MKFIDKSWESKVLKLNAYSLESQKINRLKLTDLDTLLRPSLVSVRISQSAVKQKIHLGKLGFYLVENYCLFESVINISKKLLAEKVVIKIIGLESVNVCRRLARLSFSYDRFHQDPNIKKQLADLSRASWIENSLKGRSFFVLGAFINKKLVGFIDINKKGRIGVIDLLAVNSHYRNRCIASQLINTAKHMLKNKHINKVQVGTQAENKPAIACYKKNNFKLIATFKTFHYHKP